MRNSGALEYAAVLGSPQFSFDFGGVRFAVVDSSDLNMTEERATWARDVFEGAEYKVMMTHAPPYDPFDNDHTLQEDSCGRLIELVESEEVDAVFTGHIHAYNHTITAGTDFIISGGAGATMVEGEHHFVKVAFDPASTFSFEKCEVIADDLFPSHITLTGRDGESVDMSFEDLLSLPQETGYSSFENYYGNIGGEGDYSGVAVESLLTFVGGMDEGDLLRVTAADGYSQDFGYLNVYPEESWLEMQGIMIIALSMDSIDTPDWGEGPKLLMLAPDGLYSNSDCEATSYDDQGYAVYPSAGARWVKNVMTIQVIPCP